MKDDIIDKLCYLTSPVFWALFIVVAIYDSIKWLWKKVLWNKKWGYRQLYELREFKKICSKGINEKQKEYANNWLAHNGQR